MQSKTRAESWQYQRQSKRRQLQCGPLESGVIAQGQESKQIRRRKWRRKGPPGGSRRHAKTLYVDYMSINLGAQQLYWESDCQCRYPWEIAAESYRASKRAESAQCYIMYLYQATDGYKLLWIILSCLPWKAVENQTSRIFSHQP